MFMRKCSEWWIWIWARGRTGQPADRGKGTFTLNSNQPVSGAGSGIVARPDRVRGVDKRQEGEVGGLQGQRLPSGSWGATHIVWGWGAYRRRRAGGGLSIGRFSWGADAQYADVWSNCATLNWFPLLICIRTIPRSGSGVSRAPPDKMSSRLQAAHWTCELELDFT